MSDIRSFLPILALCLGLCPLVKGAPAEVWYNTNSWFAVPGVNFDHAKDAHTNKAHVELVSDASNPGFYFLYESDTNDHLNPDGRLLFRVRVASFETDKYRPTNAPGQFGAAVFVGIDGNSDGAVDIVVVADDHEAAASGGVKVFLPACPVNGSGTCFASPARTRIGTQYGVTDPFRSTGTNQNFNWVEITGPNNNVLAGTESSTADHLNPDAYFSFAVDFRFLANTLADSIAHAGTNRPALINNFTPSSGMRFMAASGRQVNAFFQDAGGCNDGAAISSWSCAWSSTIVPMNYVVSSDPVATPEPLTLASVGSSLIWGLASFRKRRQKD